ncbi:MAG TPA: GNAT family N-acetyltransferase [Terriglobales bacterium]|nr:GNAT family N-acetyltransferase [Terriglobales bacterium]
MRPDIDLQPILRGKLIEMRPVRAQDFDALYAAASDPLIWEQHPEPDRYTREVFQRYFDGAIASKGALVAIEKKTGKIIGSSRYHNFYPEESEIEIGYTFLERKFWGGKYNGEMKTLMVKHALGFVERVVFAAGATNLRSCKALEKIGAKFLKNDQRPTRDGTLIPYVVFAITRKQPGQ